MGPNNYLEEAIIQLAHELDKNSRAHEFNDMELENRINIDRVQLARHEAWLKSMHQRQWSDWREEVSGKRPGLQWRRRPYDAWKSRRA
jgi:hypothetical protein